MRRKKVMRRKDYCNQTGTLHSLFQTFLSFLLPTFDRYHIKCFNQLTIVNLYKKKLNLFVSTKNAYYVTLNTAGVVLSTVEFWCAYM